MGQAGALHLWWRYFTFVWLFDAVPLRASELQRAAIVRGNRDRGLRYLPVYLRRYLRLFIGLAIAGWVSEAMAAPLMSGTCFTLGTMALAGLLIAGVGLAGMRLRAFDHGRY